MKLGSLVEALKHPDECIPLVKLMRAKRQMQKRVIVEPHWAFCYTMLHKISKSFTFVIQHFRPEIQDVMCVYYMVLRALDTVEDDTNLSTDVKVPILLAFHEHIYDRDWHFSCGINDHERILMDEFHHILTAFSELKTGYQKIISEIVMKVGAGMAKFVCKEHIQTIDEYDEYSQCVAGLVGLGMSWCFHDAKRDDLAEEALIISTGVFFDKTHRIGDIFEDIKEIPNTKMFWPREIWGKYVNNPKDLIHNDNSEKAVKCLNEMVTNALLHVEDGLKYMSNLHDSSSFRFLATIETTAFGTLAKCYNNIQAFRGPMRLRPGLTAKIIDRTKSMSDVYGAFYDFSSIIKAKIDKNDPNANITLSRIESIQKACRDSGTLNKRGSYIANDSKPIFAFIFILLITILLAKAYLLAYPNTNGHT